jgi:predicted nucleotidyltransferase component of viral defense system
MQKFLKYEHWLNNIWRYYLEINSARQLKAWIKNTANKNNLAANTVLQIYMMERLLERISVSKYRDNFILKGGFFIAAMIGINIRSTMDMDTTIKGISIDKNKITEIINEILLIDIEDNVEFTFKRINNIHDISKYGDFRVSIEAKFFNIKVIMKIDITTGDIIIPKEIEYSFKLLFEDRYIAIKAYNLNTILAEKVESILDRNVSNTRARDFYDVFIFLTLRSRDIKIEEARQAIWQKAK